MVNRLPSWVFIALALALMGFALLPIMRIILGVDEQIQMQFLTVTMLLIGGLMCGLTGMLLLARRQPDITYSSTQNNPRSDSKIMILLHASGLLVFTGIPLANFLACYFIWLRNRHKSALIDKHGREAVCQQITFYLYAMMCLLMALVIIGVFGLLFLLLLHALFSITGMYKATQGKLFRYPANIAIIDRKLETDKSDAQ